MPVIKLISSNGELIEESIDNIVNIALDDSTAKNEITSGLNKTKVEDIARAELQSQPALQTQSVAQVAAQAQSQVQSQSEVQFDTQSELETQPETETPELDSVTESVMLAELALNQAQQSLEDLRNQIDAVNNEKVQIIENNDFDKVNYINTLIDETNAELAQRLELVAKANQVAKEAQLAVIDSDLSAQEKLDLINKVDPIELGQEFNNLKGVVVNTETSDPATLGEIVVAIGETIWDLVKEIPKYVQPITELVIQVVVGVFGAMGAFIPHAVVGAIKLIAKIPTFIALGVEFIESGMTAVKSGIETVLNLFPVIKEGFEFLSQVLGKGFSISEFFTNLGKGISTFIEDFANFLDDRTKLEDDMSNGYETIGIHEFVGNFAELITNGLLNFIDAANKGIATAIDGSKEVALWYQENFAPAWDAFQTALANLVESVSKLITIPITAIIEVITSFVLVANESALHKVKELLGNHIDSLLDNVADVLHKIASFIGKGIDTLVVGEDSTQGNESSLLDAINSGDYQTDTADLLDFFTGFVDVNNGEDLTQLDEAALLDKFNDYLEAQSGQSLEDLLSDNSNGDINLDSLIPETEASENDAPVMEREAELDLPVHYNLDDLQDAAILIAA